jgi:serine/threonine-protein kinase HipA
LAEADGGGWLFGYFPDYAGPPVSLALPVREEPYRFSGFPPFLEGLLPEGPQLETILRRHKIDRGDCFGQLMAVGNDVVGSLTVEEPTQGEGAEA